MAKQEKRGKANAGEKVNLYLLAIVAIVAVVGIVVLILNSAGSTSLSSSDYSGQATSGDSGPVKMDTATGGKSSTSNPDVKVSKVKETTDMGETKISGSSSGSKSSSYWGGGSGTPCPKNTLC